MEKNVITFAPGNKHIEERIKKLSKARQVTKGYDVGFMGGTTYLRKKSRSEKTTNKQKGPPPTTAMTAMWNEFGTKHIPERPFFRQGNKKAEPGLIKLIDKMLNERDSYVLSEEDISLLGNYHEGQIKEAITRLREPPNKKSTIKAKKSSNPLIDSRFDGLMRKTVINKVVK